jgi:hypothetical protein
MKNLPRIIGQLLSHALAEFVEMFSPLFDRIVGEALVDEWHDFRSDVAFPMGNFLRLDTLSGLTFVLASQVPG